ncbi:BlaI/MecI/CopY family transcriptional regulator [Umezawaea tangerina]|uniref:BlaI/MecI/CopY family transcriptional regulator n=1 Tax=Umezawaea tangerina TaxID=84725 RepID=UPI000B10AE69|nr:BlaI/MecI/CopY family transcriptional regulator [Umezawaea tangerina]
MSDGGTTDDEGARSRRQPGALAAEVLTVLGASDSALTPAEVRDLLDPSGSLSYSTVVTTLTRLHDKEMATRVRDGRAYRYSAVAEPSALVAWRMGRLLDSDPDHASVLTRFVGSLSEKDERLLRDLLGKLD